MKFNWLDILYFIFWLIARPEKSGKQGNIYLMQDGDKDLYKIGRTSRSAQARYKDFKTGNPDIRLLHHFPARNQFTAESKLHKKYDKKRIPGTEWFRLNRRDIKGITSIKEM